MVVVSNTGPWEFDMWGTIAETKGTDEEVRELIKEDGYDPDDFIFYDPANATLVAVMEENEISFMCKGTIVRWACDNPTDEVPAIYFVVDL